MPIVVGLLLAIAVGAWLLRGTIATSVARSELETHGLRCDERFVVSPSALFGELTVGPTRCTHDGGLIEVIELTGDATLELEGFTPSALRANGVRLVLRDRNLRGGSGWAAELRRLHLEQRVAGLVKALSELGGMRLPPAHVGRAEVFRGGDELATIDGLVLTPGDRMGVAIDRAVFTAVMGAARLTLSGVTGTATRSDVRLQGQATARAGVVLLGTFSTGGAFTLDASALDTAAPELRLQASF